MLVVVFVVSNVALATPIPSNSTSQTWYFNSDGNPAVPEILDNPNGPVQADILRSGTTGPDPTWADGVWSGETVKFLTIIPNTDNTAPDSYKDMVVEIGFRGIIALCQVKVGDTPYSRTSRATSSYVDAADVTWTKVIDTYHIEPNPTSEYLCYGLNDLENGTTQYLDYIIIDTICVPEPLTICLLGLGGLIVGRKKRR